MLDLQQLQREHDKTMKRIALEQLERAKAKGEQELDATVLRIGKFFNWGGEERKYEKGCGDCGNCENCCL